MQSVVRKYRMSCEECEFTTNDAKLIENHNCDTNRNGGRCEDFPCCGHEMGDCNGERYGSDESIIEQAYRDMAREDLMEANWYDGDEEDESVESDEADLMACFYR